jgi:hypothetical protein
LHEPAVHDWPLGFNRSTAEIAWKTSPLLFYLFFKRPWHCADNCITSISKSQHKVIFIIRTD